METQILNLKGESVGKIELPKNVFEVEPKAKVLHEVATVYLTNQRRGQANTKTRTEVSGGGHKPWKQKHTGRARAGSNRSPLWRHGGIAHGPRRHSHRIETTRSKSKIALAYALSARASAGAILVIEALTLDGAKTKQVSSLLKALEARNKSLIVIETFDAGLATATRNIPDLKVMLAAHLNAYAVLNCDKLIITKGALEKLSARWN